MRGQTRRDKDHLIELKLIHGRLCDGQMPDVDRIKRPAENTDTFVRVQRYLLV